MKTDSSNSTNVPVWTNNVEILTQEVSMHYNFCKNALQFPSFFGKEAEIYTS